MNPYYRTVSVALLVLLILTIAGLVYTNQPIV